jgi:Holliday junction resolvase
MPRPENVTRGKRNKRRGSDFEREVVNELIEAGLKAQRVPLSGATPFAKGDVEVVAGFDGKTRFTGECKRRARLPKIFEELGDFDFLALREDRGETLVVIRLKTFAELLQ